MKNLKERLISTYISNADMFKCLCILVLASSVLSSCSTYRINRLKNKSYKEWKSFQWTETTRSLDKEVAEWTIYSRKVKGTNFIEYKIEGEIESSSEACISAFRQAIHQQTDSIENKNYPVYKIVNESTDSLLTYVIHNEPFPLKDTEMSVKYSFSKDYRGDAEIIWHEAWDKISVPPSKKLNRVETFRGSWQFSKVTEDQLKVVNIVQFDPKKMPQWLVKPMVTKFLRKEFESLKETATN